MPYAVRFIQSKRGANYLKCTRHSSLHFLKRFNRYRRENNIWKMMPEYSR